MSSSIAWDQLMLYRQTDEASMAENILQLVDVLCQTNINKMKNKNTKTKIERFTENFLKAEIIDLNKLENADVTTKPVRVRIKLTYNRGSKTKYMNAWISFEDENTFTIDFKLLNNYSFSGSWIRVSETEFVKIFSDYDDNVKKPESEWNLIRLKSEYNQIMKMNHFLFDQELKEIADPGSIDPASKKLNAIYRNKFRSLELQLEQIIADDVVNNNEPDLVFKLGMINEN
jgi:hypothetical protein